MNESRLAQWPEFYVLIDGTTALRYQASPAAIRRFGHNQLTRYALHLLVHELDRVRQPIDQLDPQSGLTLLRTTASAEFAFCLTGEIDDFAPRAL